MLGPIISQLFVDVALIDAEVIATVEATFDRRRLVGYGSGSILIGSRSNMIETRLMLLSGRSQALMK